MGAERVAASPYRFRHVRREAETVGEAPFLRTSEARYVTIEPLPGADSQARDPVVHQPDVHPIPPAPATRQLTPPRITGSAWAIGRGGASQSLGSGGQLGGSQAGFRAYVALTPQLSATARVSAALLRPGRDASVGLAVKRGPVALLIERRFALDKGGRNDWSLTLAGGFDHLALPARMRLDGYGQAGVVGSDAFADGAVRVERDILRRGDVTVSAGAGAWGAVQPHLDRLDLGPQIVVRFPVATHVMRISAEWRARVAGNADPASGPSVGLATNF